MSDVTTIEAKFKALRGRFDETSLRIWAAAEASSLGRGGISTVAKAVGMSRTTIHTGLSEIKKAASLESGLPSQVAKGQTALRVRARGGGRKKLTSKDDSLLGDLDALMEPTTRAEPMSALRWTCKSTHQLAVELKKKGHQVSQRTICYLLSQMHYSLQSTRKTREGGKHEDREAQFMHIAKTVADYQASGNPVIAVDTKKKELFGDFKNVGQEWQPAGTPEEVRVDDFIDAQLGKVAPYFVYDETNNNGWVNVGIDHDTAEFTVESIRRWWLEMGKTIYPEAGQLLITADCGGSNGYRVRSWRRQLQKFADEQQLSIQVCHFPPGTSKWNKIEHRMFCHITAKWRGRPLVSREVVVNLIGSTTTTQGLHVRAALNEHAYTTGLKVSDQELAALNTDRDAFHGEWNYRVLPHNSLA
ncbi:MAG: ISAzo13 family transposase [Comamonadaceae bacterium]|nr:ISAzo13 family transposase [Comamonadaceae bacterium]